MTIRLIYHDHHTTDATSPFDIEIVRIAKGNELRIACPYLSIQYIQRITKLCTAWKLITDVQEWLFSLPRPQQEMAIQFMAENRDSVRHISRLHAKVLMGGNLALIGSANFTNAGIRERVEMSILIEEETVLDELYNWYETNWRVGIEPPHESDLYAYIGRIGEPKTMPIDHKAGLFPESVIISRPLMVLSESRLDRATSSLDILEPMSGTQYQIIDAILGAYKYAPDGNWLSAEEQVKLLGKAYHAKLSDGRNAFPAMHGNAEFGDPPPGPSGRSRHWDWKNRINRMNTHVGKGMAIKGDGLMYMLSKGITPAQIGVSQEVVDALSAFGIIPRYDIDSCTHTPHKK